MSKIDKLGIRGIRSFGPFSIESVSFNTPLTLIVGENGSGKTTIIECLKYATTGEQPPNSKNGAFLHDPKLCGEKEVKAQVKLSFFSTIGQRLVVTRSLQVTNTKKKSTMKTIDGTLQIINGHEKITLSKKNADLDEMMPEKMGVPAAILESVIFCHQDDSLWPLSEPSVLKKKFDELFEAIKYTKAIENLKVLRKKHGEKMRGFKKEEETHKHDKEKGERYEKTMKNLHAEVESLSDQYKEIIVQMKTVGKQEKEKREQANSFLGIMNELKTKTELYNGRKQIASELQASIERMEEPDEALEAALTQYGDKVKQMTEDAEVKAARYSELQRELADSRKSLQQKHGERGKLVSDKEHYERQVETRIDMIREAAQRHEIRGYDGDLSDAQVRAFESRTQKILDEKRREVTRLNAALEKKKDEHDRQISELVTRKHALASSRSSTQERINEASDKTTKLQRDIAALHVDEGRQAVLESNLAQTEERLKVEQEELSRADLDRHIDDETETLRRLEAEADQLTSELVQCTRVASDRAQLDVRRKELDERKLRLEALTTTWGDKLSRLTGKPLDSETIGDDFRKVMEKHDDEVAKMRKNVESAQSEVKQIDFKLSSVRDEEKKLSAELKRCEKVVCDAQAKAVDEDDEDADQQPPHVDNYLARLKQLEEDSIEAEKDISLFDALADFYSKIKDTVDTHNKCQMCDRSFGAADAEAKSKLLLKVARKINPKTKNLSIQDLKSIQTKISTLMPARASYEAYQRSKARPATLRTEIDELQSQKDAVVARLEKHDASLRDAEEKRQDVEAMGKTVRNMTDAVAQIAESEKEIDRLASQQSSGGAVRSAQEIHDLQAACTERSRAAKNKLSKLNAERQRRKETISQLELEKRELQIKLNDVAQKLQRRRDLTSQVQSLKEEKTRLQEAKDQTAKDLEALEPQISKARTLREEEVARGREKVEKAEEQRDFIANTVDKLRSIGSDIQDYIHRGGPGLLVANERAIKSIEEAVERLEKEVAALTAEINKLRQEMENSDRKKKNIQDNLAFNRTSRALEELRREIQGLERRNADEDWARLDAECGAFKRQYDVLSGQSHGIMGTIQSKNAELDRMMDEYNREYKDSKLHYREAHIRVETTKAAIEDMAAYSAALEKAIMSYHSLKMEEVNRIAGELWRSTYQGTDIDTILIRSEVETSGGTSATSTTRRTYNYRLCMVKQDTEMDMRGRCSAGQKVLASIIIRLALAESFGVNCGLIALDEPTTNLDEANIRSLAISLHNIIQARQAQANFQLIVITHDEAFLRAMQCSDFCDTFYRVKRDEKQRSTIMRENISSLMD